MDILKETQQEFKGTVDINKLSENIKTILSTRAGQEFFKDFFIMAQLFGRTMTGNSWTYFWEGRRDMANQIWTEVIKANNDVASKIFKEVTTKAKEEDDGRNDKRD